MNIFKKLRDLKIRHDFIKNKKSIEEMRKREEMMFLDMLTQKRHKIK